MSVDHSLRIKGALKRHRNVLSRAERVEQLKDEERWVEGQSVFGLPKIAHRKSHAGRKAAKEEAAAVEGAVPGVTPEALAAGAKPAAGVKPAAAGVTPVKEKAAEKPKEKGKQKATGKT